MPHPDLSHAISRCACAALGASEPDAVTRAIVTLLAHLGARWHVVITGQGTGHRRKLTAHRCSRALVERVVGGLDLVRNEPSLRTYCVDAGLAGVGNDWARCAFGLPLDSARDEDDLDQCLDLVRQALHRLLSLTVERRRARLLALVLGRQAWHVFIFNAHGALVEQHPAGVAVPDVVTRSVGSPRPSKSLRDGRTVVVDHQRMELIQFWIEGDGPDEERLLVVELTPSQTVAADVRRHFHEYGLTHREVEVADLIVQGRSNRVIASTLGISHDTVKTHCRHIFGKLGIARRTDFLPLLTEPADAEVPQS
jgi:DNA-binding CsgD family transcriptional regulator